MYLSFVQFSLYDFKPTAEYLNNLIPQKKLEVTFGVFCFLAFHVEIGMWTFDSSGNTGTHCPLKLIDVVAEPRGSLNSTCKFRIHYQSSKQHSNSYADRTLLLSRMIFLPCNGQKTFTPFFHLCNQKQYQVLYVPGILFLCMFTLCEHDHLWYHLVKMLSLQLCICYQFL